MKNKKCQKIVNQELKRNEVVSGQRTEFEKIKAFSNVQITRYGFFRRSDLKKEKIKKILIQVCPNLKNINSSDTLVISIKGLVKLFIGKLVERSKKRMLASNDSVDWSENPIQIEHLFQIMRE
jgi:hypothetical protein